MGHHGRRSLGDTEIHDPVDEEAPTHAKRTDARWEDFGSNHVAGYTVTKTPAKGINVDPNDPNDTTGFGTASCIRVGEAHIESDVEHGGSLQSSTDHKWEATSNAVDDKGDIYECRDKLDHAIDSSCEESLGATFHTNHGEDFRCKVVETVFVKNS